MLHANNEQLGQDIEAAVDPDADWTQQIRQAVEAYVSHIEERPAVTLSWIRSCRRWAMLRGRCSAADYNS